MLGNNIALVFTILASVISLLCSMYDKVAKKKNLRLILVSMFLVFFLATAKLVIDDIQKKNSAILKQQIETRRDMVAEEIRGNVQEGLKIGLEGLEISRKTINLLEELKPQLSGKSVSTIGVKLTGLGTEEMHIFQKGDIDALKPFVTKVEGLLDEDMNALPAISLTLNADRHYIPGLMYNQMGMYARVQDILNVPDMATKETLSRFFKSFRSDVLTATDAYAAAEVMIDNNINKTIAEYGDHYWLINLARIVELVS